MAGELLVRVLKLGAYEKAAAEGPILEGMHTTLFQDAGCWNLSGYSGPGWVLLDNWDFSDVAWDIIESTYKLPLLDGFACEESCPALVTDEVIKIWGNQLTAVMIQPKLNPVVLEIAKALLGLVELVRGDERFRLTVQGLL